VSQEIPTFEAVWILIALFSFKKQKKGRPRQGNNDQSIVNDGQYASVLVTLGT